jgi:hypothetical protein
MFNRVLSVDLLAPNSVIDRTTPSKKQHKVTFIGQNAANIIASFDLSLGFWSLLCLREQSDKDDRNNFGR